MCYQSIIDLNLNFNNLKTCITLRVECFADKKAESFAKKGKIRDFCEATGKMKE